MTNYPDLHIELYQGADFSQTFYYKDSNGAAIPLTGYTAACQFRKTKKSTEALISLSTEDGNIVIDEAEGYITITIPGEDIEAIDPGEVVWDLFIFTPVTLRPDRFIGGTAEVISGVYRAEAA